MEIEKALVSKAVHTGSIQKLILKGVREEHLIDEASRSVWEFCTEYIRKYKSNPSIEAVTKGVDDFKFEVVTDSLDYLFDEFVKLVKRRAAINGLMELSKLVDNPEKVNLIDEEILNLGFDISKMFLQGSPSSFSNMGIRIEEYAEQEGKQDHIGIQTGIPSIDEVTYGIQPHELVTIAGWQGQGKSTLAQFIAFNAYMQGYTPLIISLEMEAKAILRKLDVIATHVQYKNLKSMNLSDEEKERWKKFAAKAERASSDIIIIDDLDKCSIETVYSLGKQYQPNILIIDYLTLMDLPGSRLSQWEKITELTRSIKKMARSVDFPPIIAVAQTNVDSASRGTRLSNIGYSKSIGADSDIVIGLYQDEEGEMKSNNQMQIRLEKNRDGETKQINMFWDMSTMTFQEWEPSKMFISKKEELIQDAKRNRENVLQSAM